MATKITAPYSNSKREDMSNIVEQKEVRQFKDVIIGCKCDNCGKIVNTAIPDDWYHFNAHHGDWGNDSGESYEYFDACSPRCFLDLVWAAVVELKGHENTGEIADMPYKFAKKLVEELTLSHKPAQ